MYDRILVYHGSTHIVEDVDLSSGRVDVDFGQGFYVTTNKEQALRWAKRRSLRLGEPAILNIYSFAKIANLKILELSNYTEEWLDYVILNRTRQNNTEINYDLVMGNVADDDVINAIDRYLELIEKGHATKNTKLALLDELRFSKPNDQICFKSTKSLECLRFEGSEVVDD